MSMVEIYIHSNSLYTYNCNYLTHIKYILKALSYIISLVDLGSPVKQCLDHFE